MSRILNEFIKGVLWGFVAFVHFTLVVFLIHRFTMNCLPAEYVMRLACLPGPGAAQCPMACTEAKDVYFYWMLGSTAVAAVLLPLGLGVYWVFKTRSKPTSAR